ncbi:MAG: hypothetical protein C4523_19970 [Myxococcales bacterium]|nr:MAG: hypothetical protein C4523_19970 [Myxococcales bacterium]
MEGATMNIRRMLWPKTALFAMAAVVSCVEPSYEPTATQTPTPGAAKENPPMGYTLELTGSGLAQPSVVDLNELRRMKLVRLDNVLMQKSHGPDELSSWRGVLLEAVLKSAGLRPGPMNVELRGEDRFTRRTTLDLLESAIIALEDGEGRALAEIEEDYIVRLVPPRLTGDYWIVNVCTITVEQASD